MLWRHRRRVGDVLVSVVMCVRDAGAQATEALISVLHSQLDDLEVVLVPDGASEQSVAALAAADDARVRVVRPSDGVRAVDAGIRAARGTYLCFLDAADIVPPQALAALAASLEASGSDLAVGARCDVVDGVPVPPSAAMQAAHGAALRAVSAELHPQVLASAGLAGKLVRRSYWDERLSPDAGVPEQALVARLYLTARIDVLAEVTVLRRVETQRDDRAGVLARGEVLGAVLRSYDSVPALRRARVGQLITWDAAEILACATPGDAALLEAITTALHPALSRVDEAAAREVPVDARVGFLLAAAGDWDAYFAVRSALDEAEQLVGKTKFVDRMLVVVGRLAALGLDLPDWAFEPPGQVAA